MKILIVDDEPLARERIREMLKSEQESNAVFEAGNGGEAVEIINSNAPDVVFLDIQMPDMNGFQVLKALDEKQFSRIPAIVFVTAYDQYALQAFEFHAIDYLLKPFDRERFAETFRLIKERVKEKSGEKYTRRIVNLLEKMDAAPEYLEWITLKKDERIMLFRVDDIHWIEAQGNYALLKFKDSSQLLRETMDNLEAQLNPRMFIRIHRSTIVNIHQIKELQVWARGEYRVVMKGGKMLTLSRNYRNRFDNFFKKGIL